MNPDNAYLPNNELTVSSEALWDYPEDILYVKIDSEVFIRLNFSEISSIRVDAPIQDNEIDEATDKHSVYVHWNQSLTRQRTEILSAPKADCERFINGVFDALMEGNEFYEFNLHITEF